MYDAKRIANWFIGRAQRDNRTLTIMQLLKLVYISHGWHLEMYRAPLFANRIEAWKFGPVIPDIYNAFRKQGIEANRTVDASGLPISTNDQGLLEQIYTGYGNMSAQRLSDLTHELGGPWDISTKKYGYFAPIANDVILPHYEMKRRQFNENSQKPN